jgi:hypothetical protein
VPLVYCDHNFVVTSGQGPDPYKDHLRQVARAGGLTFVLSPFHWMETAEDTDVGRGEATADFMDALNGQWLRERRNIQRKEVEAAFFRFAKIPSESPQMVVNVTDIIADLAGQPGDRPSRAFVTHLRGVGPEHPLKDSLSQALAKNRENIGNYQAGTFTPAFRRGVETLYVKQLLPTNTPAGLLIDEATKKDFLKSQKLTDFPSLALETLATYDNWKEARQMTRNNFLDQQHVMALPYVNLFLTNDKRLTALIARIVDGMPFKCATVITKAQFDGMYP